MAASTSKAGVSGIGMGDKTFVGDDELNKTMEGISLGSMDDDVTEKGKGRDDGEGGNVLQSLLFETASRMSVREKMAFMREMSRNIDMERLKKQGVQFDPYEEEAEVFGLDKDLLTNIPAPSHISASGHSAFGLGDKSGLEDVRPVKIKPADKGLIFKEGDDIERFLGDFDDAAYIDGASDLDKCIQVKFFIPDKEMKTVIEGMEGYRRKNWAMLKRNMIEIWGAGLLPLYTLNDLDALCDQLRTAGGIKTYGVYVKFQSKFRTMLNHLRASGQIEKGDSKIIATKYYRVFSREIQEKARNILAQEGDLMPNGRVVQMPSIVVLENAFKKVLVTRNAWETMSLDEGGANPTEESAVCGSVLSSFKTRRQVNLGAKPGGNPSAVELKELKKKLEAALKENEAYKARRYQPREYGGYQKKEQDGRQETSKETSGYSGSSYDRGNQPYICHYCSSEGHSARICFRFKQDEADGLVKLEGRDYYLPDGKLIPWNPSRPIRTVVADWSAKNSSDGKIQEVKEEEKPSVKTSVGKLDCWNRPAVSSSGRVSFEVDMARRMEAAQPVRRSSRLNGDYEMEKEKEKEKGKERVEEDVADESMERMDRTRFSTPEWEGPSESKKGPMQSTPKSILKRGATIEDSVDEDVLVLDDEGLGICDPSMVQAERNRVLKDVFIDQGKKTRKPSYIAPEVPTKSGGTVKNEEDLDGGLDIVLQKIFDTKVTLTIKELTAISPALAKAVSEGNFGGNSSQGFKDSICEG